VLEDHRWMARFRTLPEGRNTLFGLPSAIVLVGRTARDRADTKSVRFLDDYGQLACLKQDSYF